MTTEGTTLNSGAASAAAASSTAAGNFDTMIPTMPEDASFPPPAEALNTEGGEAETQKGDGSQGESAESAPGEKGEEKPEAKTETGENVPFHKHPRFQALIAKNKELESTLNELKRQQQQSGGGSQAGGKESGPPDADQVMAEIARQLEEGEISVSEALAKQKQALETGMTAKFQQMLDAKSREVDARQLEQSFLKENPDFVELRDSGELQSLIEANPLHDNISAYYAYKAEKAAREASEKAVKETEERLRKEYTSKRNAASLGPGASRAATGNTVSPALADTKKFGGRTAVLAERLKALRTGRGL